MVTKPRPLTAGIHSLAQLRLHLAVGPLGGQLRQLAGHGGGRDDGLEAALAFGDVLLGVEDDDVDLRHVEHAQRDGGAEAERDGQRGCLDVHLRGENSRGRSYRMAPEFRGISERQQDATETKRYRHH